MDLPPEEKADFDHFIKTHNNVFSIQDNKSLFICLAWVIPMEQHHFPVLIQFIIQIKINVIANYKLKRYTHGKMLIILS